MDSINKIFKLCTMFTLIFFIAKSSSAASCYPESMKNAVAPTYQTVLILIDETSPRDGSAEKNFREGVNKVLEGTAKNIKLLAFAGNSPGQHLRLLGQWSIEDPITDEEVINNTIISVYRKSQSCIKKTRAVTKSEVLKSLETTFSAMPLFTERSEIEFALASSIKDFSREGQSLLVMVYSDGIQYSKGENGRSFYAGNAQGLPRKIDPIVELKYAAKDPLTAPRKKTGFVSVVWHGLLALPTPKANEKPIYLDTGVIGSFTTFWHSYLLTQGVEKIQLGTPVLNNVDLTLPNLLSPN